jgi:hypothetical protein
MEEIEDTQVVRFYCPYHGFERRYSGRFDFIEPNGQLLKSLLFGSAKSFNAKIKSFRSSSRGVRDIPFFLFRLANIYA